VTRSRRSARLLTLLAVAALATTMAAGAAPAGPPGLARAGLAGGQAPATPSTPATPLTPSTPAISEDETAPTSPDDVMLARTAGTGRVVPAGAYTRAREQAATVGAQTRQLAPQLAGAGWNLVGPTNVGGRVLDIVVDPRAPAVAGGPQRIFVATASGGVWRSDDAGTTYSSVWPDDLPQPIGALAISRTGILYAGTGEAGPGGGSLTYGGHGVYRSTDAGATWQSIGLTGTDRIGRIVVDPTDDNRVFVAANGPLFAPGGERGLYLSTNAGDSWTRVLAGDNATTGAVDVAVDPVNPKNVYATTWDRIRYPDRRVYTGAGSGVYKSTDGGVSWSRIGAVAGVGNPAYGPNPKLGRLGVAVAPTNPNRIYVLSSTDLGATLGVWRSDDAGTTFTPTASISLATGGFVYAWWFGRIYVDPTNPDHVYSTGVNLSESTDGGRSFSSAAGSTHADQHGIAYDPTRAGRLYLGNDGGTYRSDDNGKTWTHGVFMPWNQPFSVDVSQTRPQRVVAGLQDNGGRRSWTKGGAAAGPNLWNDYTGGDGTETRINPNNDLIVYGCSQYGACAVSHDGADTNSSFEDSVAGSRKNWLTPIEFDPQDPSTVYTASEIVSRSTDDGANWTPISPDLSNGPGMETNPLFKSYGTVTTIAPAPARTGIIYAGTDDGNIQYTRTGGIPWTKATAANLPHDWVTKIAVDASNPDVAYATFSGFRSAKTAASVFRTADGGVTWTDVSGNLPQAPVNSILLVGDNAYVATDVGVFLARSISTGLGAQWLRVGSGLPQTPVWDLAYQKATNTLYAADFGRGVYALPLDSTAGVEVPEAPWPVLLPIPAVAAAAYVGLRRRRRRAA